MSTTPLIPQAFWFRLALYCPLIDNLPRTGAKGRLLDLPAACALPELTRLEGQVSWADVRVAWNPRGLAVAVEVTGNPGSSGANRRNPEYADAVQVWVDTRDTRDVHRATRFCHRFSLVLVPAGASDALDVTVTQRPIHRALAAAPQARPETIAARAEWTRKGWRAELFLMAGALHGFDPETNRRLGFMIQVTDPVRGDQFLGLGREFPVGEDPSLWATLELQGGG